MRKLGVTFRSKNVIPDGFCTADELNHFYLNNPLKDFIPSSELIDSYSNTRVSGVCDSLEFMLVTENQIKDTILKLKSNAGGHDQITLTMLKYSLSVTLPIITHIVNTCLGNNVFPNSWKISVVVPLAKLCNPKELKDIRPISLLPVLSKVCEKVIAEQLNIYLDKYTILPTNQSGFRKKYSCATALLGVTDDIFSALDSNKLLILILLDFSKAFDTVNYDLLFAILKHIGIGISALKLFKNYFSNRTQFVALHGDYSTHGYLTCGVPQGSILGPILFTIYTSVIIKNIQFCKSHFYADDSQLYHSFLEADLATAVDQINSDLQSFSSASRDHALIVNPQKTKMMLFGKMFNPVLRDKIKSLIDIRVDDDRLEFVDSAKSLGLIIDYKLRFAEHVSRSIQKAFASLKTIYSIRKILNYKCKIIMCDSLVLSHFNYADCIYGPCLDFITRRKVQLVQNCCMRLIFGIKKRQRITCKLKVIPWLSMEGRRHLHAACTFHKIIYNKCPPYLLNKVRFRTDVHNINIRRKDIITVPVHAHNFFTRSYSYYICKVYNSIPSEFKQMTPAKFKNKFCRYLSEA